MLEMLAWGAAAGGQVCILWEFKALDVIPVSGIPREYVLTLHTGLRSSVFLRKAYIPVSGIPREYVLTLHTDLAD